MENTQGLKSLAGNSRSKQSSIKAMAAQNGAGCVSASVLKRAAKAGFGLCFLFLAAAAFGEKPARNPLPTRTPNLEIMRSAHRGVSAYAPENTLPAIRKAIELGYAYVEIDVRYTRDGAPVLMHDGSLLRTTNGWGKVSSKSLSEIKKLDAGFWRVGFRGTEVPTLEQALELMQGRIKLYLDLKQGVRPELIVLLKRYGFYPDNLVVCCAIDELLKYEPEAPVMPFLGDAGPVEELLRQYPSAVAFDSKCGQLTAEMVREAHRHGVMVFTDALGLSSEKCMRRPIEFGADVIQFDNLRLYSKVLARMKSESRAPAEN